MLLSGRAVKHCRPVVRQRTQIYLIKDDDCYSIAYYCFNFMH